MASELEIIAENVKRHRLRQGLTQQQLASACQVAQARIAELETGKNDVRVTTLSRVATGLGLPVAALLIPAESPVTADSA